MSPTRPPYPDREYRLYGVRYWLAGMVTALTNAGFTRLAGDSAYVTHDLRALGFDLSEVRRTGSNFGLTMKQDSPYASRVGSGTMVSDGLTIANLELSNGAFRMSRVAIGADTFLGNHITYPSGGRAGDNVLLATKVMVPVDGERRENVGLLGSPPIMLGAFAHLTPSPQRRSGGISGFTRGYRDVASVHLVDGPVSRDATHLTATVRIRLRGGAVRVEQWEYALAPGAGSTGAPMLLDAARPVPARPPHRPGRRPSRPRRRRPRVAADAGGPAPGGRPGSAHRRCTASTGTTPGHRGERCVRAL